MKHRILFVIAFQWFRDEEYAAPKAMLEEAGFQVITASTAVGTAIGKFGMETTVDIEYSDASAADYEAIVFIGGPGSPGYWDDPVAHRLLRSAAASDKIVAGICSGCVTLAKAGVLKNRRATVWPGDADVFRPLVGKYTASACERDGLFVTAHGPDAADQFGRALVELLT